MNFVSVSIKEEDLDKDYEKNIKIFRKILKEKGKNKMVSFLKKNKNKYPMIKD